MNNTAQPIVARTVPTFARGVSIVTAFFRPRRRRLAFAAVALGCGLLYLAGHFSAEQRALRRVRELGGIAIGREQSPYFPAAWASRPVTRLLVQLTQRMEVSSLKIEQRPATDVDLRLFAAAFPKCGTLYASATPITDAAFADPDVDWSGLNRLAVGQTAVGDAALERIARIPQLWELDLNDTPITDAGVAHLRDHAEIYKLNLNGTRITDAALEDLARMPMLHALSLAGTRITDAGLAHLATAPKLYTLDVSDTQVTDAGVTALHAANRYCRIQR